MKRSATRVADKMKGSGRATRASKKSAARTQQPMEDFEIPQPKKTAKSSARDEFLKSKGEGGW